MSLENDKIKDLFAAKLNNFEPDVPASVWGGLDLLLSQQPAPVADPTSSASSSTSSATTSSSASSTTSTVASSAAKVSIFKAVAVAAGVAVAVTTGVILVTDDEPSVPPIVEQSQTVVIDSTENEMPEIDSTTIIIDPQLFAAKQTRQSKEIVEDKALEEPSISTEIPERDHVKEKEPNPLEEDIDILDDTTEPILAIAPASRGLSVGILSGAGVFAHDNNQQGGALLFSNKYINQETSRLLMSQVGHEYELEHKQPISFGLTIGKRLTPRLSIETGLQYTYLSSAIKSVYAFRVDEKQTFHYIGIPLSLNYTFYEWNKVKMYISVGGLVQKDIQGRYVSDIRLEDPLLLPKNIDLPQKTALYSKNKISQDNPQFSARLMFGTSYPIYRNIYLYGTVGGAYFFDAGNAYRTIYSDEKMQLDLNLGVKFDF